MSKYPVEIGDDEGVADALNYLLSGPGGLGQNFAGLVSTVPNWVTGNFRIPYTQTTVAKLYVPTINLSGAEMLDLRTFKYTFASTQTSPPFGLGNGITVSGFSDPIYNNDNTSSNGTNQIGVIACTTTYFVVRSTDIAASIHAPETAAASCLYYSTSKGITSDPYKYANQISVQDLRVTVTSATDRTFISNQCDLKFTYEATTSGTAYIATAIDRYKGFVNNDPTNPDYLFNFDQNVIHKNYSFPFTAGTGTIEFTSIFTSCVDTPLANFVPAPGDYDKGYYRYFYNLSLGSDVTNFADFQFTECEVNVRSMSTQVVKQ